MGILGNKAKSSYRKTSLNYFNSCLTILLLILLYLTLSSPVALASDKAIVDNAKPTVYFGFFPSNTNPETYQPNWTALTHVANLDWTLTNDGKFVNRNSDTDKHTKIIFTNAKANGVKTLISCMGTSANCDSILAYYQDDFIQNAADKISSTGAEGIILDFEYPGSTNSYTGASNTPLFEEFMRKLNSKVKSINSNYTVAICTPPYFNGVTTVFQNENLKNYVDFVFIMGYDYHYSGPTGANSPFYNDSIRHGLKFSIAEQAPIFGKEKLVYGVPFYGYEYTATSDQPEAPILSKDGEFFLRDVSTKFANYPHFWDPDSQTPYVCYVKSSCSNSKTVLDNCDILGSTALDYRVNRTLENGAYKCTATTDGAVYMLVKNSSRWDISSANYVNIDLKAPTGRTLYVRLFSNDDADYITYTVTANGEWQHINIPFTTLNKYGNFDPSSICNIRVDMYGSISGDTYYVDNITVSTGIDSYYQAWFDDTESLSLKYQYIKEQGLRGIGYWALGYEGQDSDIWNVFSYNGGYILPENNTETNISIGYNNTQENTTTETNITSDNNSTEENATLKNTTYMEVIFPNAFFSASQTIGNVPLVVNFTDTSTGNITSRKWSFGDGKTSTVENPTHRYSTAGNYTISLLVKNPNGESKLTIYNYIKVV